MLDSIRPFTVAARAVEAVWGGGRLRDLLGRDLPAGRPIGETWEVHDDDLIEGGSFAGQPLGQVAGRSGEALVGRRGASSCGPGRSFPLLLKFIDATAMLSVQVHPSDADPPGGAGKTEAYYVLEARPGAKLYYGLTPDVDRAALRRAIEENALERCLTSVDVRAGDVVYTPAGTIHAFGAGLVFFEIQQCSTVTYRLYDWGRVGIDGQPRQLHVEESLAVARFPQPPARKNMSLTAPDLQGERRILAAGPHFALEALEATGASRLDGGTFHLLTSLGVGATVVGERFGDVALEHGRTLVVPASAGDYRYTPPAGGRLLRSYVPDLDADVVAPLRAAGRRDDEIALLGEPF